MLGMQESIYRAAVSDLTPISIRGTAYGIFNTAYGVGFLVSGGIYGLLMDFNAPFTVTLLLVVVVQTAAVIALLHASSASRKQPNPKPDRCPMFPCKHVWNPYPP